MCYSADVTGSSFSVHRGLAAKLFTILTLLGAIAVTVTGALGYFREREALGSAIFDRCRLALTCATWATARAYRRGKAFRCRRLFRQRARPPIGQLCFAFNGMVEDLREKNEVIQNENRENEELLLNVLPAPIANRLRGGEAGIADGFAEVTVAFADLVGYLSSRKNEHS